VTGGANFAHQFLQHVFQHDDPSDDTVSIGHLEIGMTVHAKDGVAEGTVTKFIRRESHGRAEELAVVKWSDEPEHAAPMTALVPLDAGSTQYANR